MTPGRRDNHDQVHFEGRLRCGILHRHDRWNGDELQAAGWSAGRSVKSLAMRGFGWHVPPRSRDWQVDQGRLSRLQPTPLLPAA